MGTIFSADIQKFVEKANGNIETVIRKVSFDLFRKVIAKSPVGNPDNWKGNEQAVYQRETYNLFAQRINENLQPGDKPTRIFTPRTLKKKFPNVVGKTYVGGRFKGNWQVALNSIPAGALDTVDASGGQSLARVTSTVTQMKAGDVITLVNNVPYARRLEFGHSKQAPVGMVRTTAQEYGAIVSKAVSEVPK